MRFMLFLQEDFGGPPDEVVKRATPFLLLAWPVLVPLVLGFLAIYLLLPRPQRSGPWLGGAAGAAALVTAGLLLLHTEQIWPETLLFYTFAGLAVLAAGLMLTQSNPVYAALSFALVVLSSCGLFLLQGAPFLMAATIIIYAGAIVVTFLFVIMLAQQEGQSNADQRSREPFLATLAGFVLMGAALLVLQKSLSELDARPGMARLRALADAGSLEDADRILGQKGRANKELQRIVHLKALDELKIPKDDPFSERVLQIEKNWAARDLDRLKASALAVADELDQRSKVQGTLTRGNVPGKEGVPGELPARNVYALGQTLFTDYLIPVELAGVLLLVATIGAIAIAGRHSEVLR